ncbi:UNVERIFIED_CONTAM: hypothetical protein NCL1_18243 [Trichonephila clavipes]
MSNMLNANVNPYNLTMEDRMRWAHISEVVKSTTVKRSVIAHCVTPPEGAELRSSWIIKPISRVCVCLYLICCRGTLFNYRGHYAIIRDNMSSCPSSRVEESLG